MKNPSKPPISQALVLRTRTLLWKTSWVHPNPFMLEFLVNSKWFTEAEDGHQGTLQAIRVHQILQKFLETHTETSLYPPYTIRATVSAMVSFTFFCGLLINASVHTQSQLIWPFQTFPNPLPLSILLLKNATFKMAIVSFSKENRSLFLPLQKKNTWFFKRSLWSRRELSRVIDASRSSWASNVFSPHVPGEFWDRKKTPRGFLLAQTLPTTMHSPFFKGLILKKTPWKKRRFLDFFSYDTFFENSRNNL